MNNIMVDLETLGTGAKSVIISIGAIAFDEQSDELGQGFYREVDINSCLQQGLEIDGSTVAWWIQQSEQARKVFKADGKTVALSKALVEFTDFLSFVSKGDLGGIKIWGNGASFDNSILSEAYNACELEQPWKFWNDRCYRTVKNLYNEVRADERQGTYHNALDDAKFQAHHLIKICQVKGLKL